MEKDEGKEIQNCERVRIKQLRESMGLRRTEFGAKIGYTHQQIVRIEDGLTPVAGQQ